ncbi:MAG: hypothetical protein M3R25_15320, partial [Bacteroidota bacterium]|nr:hypothetical protein [Bacteroidota bacterium]
MEIPLSNFEEFIDDKILTQGLSLFTKGKVEYSFNINPFTSEFLIHDTNDYKFILHIENNVVIDYVCECPYDQGPVCKHLAAVIFYLRRDELMLDEVKPRTKSKPANNSKPRVVSEKTQITKLLENISPEILKKYFADTVLKDKAQRSKFLTHFAAENENESQEIYNAQIKALLRTGNRRRYIDRTT